ncbi:hypothetical protein [Cohnella luojiensis]|uniref:Uncharacterized protein n=1 Tax=Cohnella luojiensis TaxID=652876 RepID=A0A4Y8LSS2_9BACL|nr:hypothetical protein [Cohnella luojiensis]TFE19737.1 hypothetical protein E2980_22295 [Cohnella luojiensis]
MADHVLQRVNMERSGSFRFLGLPIALGKQDFQLTFVGFAGSGHGNPASLVRASFFGGGHWDSFALEK